MNERIQAATEKALYEGPCTLDVLTQRAGEHVREVSARDIMRVLHAGVETNQFVCDRENGRTIWSLSERAEQRLGKTVSESTAPRAEIKRSPIIEDPLRPLSARAKHLLDVLAGADAPIPVAGFLVALECSRPTFFSALNEVRPLVATIAAANGAYSFWLKERGDAPSPIVTTEQPKPRAPVQPQPKKRKPSTVIVRPFELREEISLYPNGDEIWIQSDNKAKSEDDETRHVFVAIPLDQVASLIDALRSLHHDMTAVTP